MEGEEFEPNMMSAWIKEQATILNKPYGDIQRILLIPTARGHKQLFSKWSAFKRTLPKSKPIQYPTQLYAYAEASDEPYERLGQPEYEEVETEKGPRRMVVWRTPKKGENDITKWYIPKEFRTSKPEPELTEKQLARIEKIKKERKKKKEKILVEAKDDDMDMEELDDWVVKAQAELDAMGPAPPDPDPTPYFITRPLTDAEREEIEKISEKVRKQKAFLATYPINGLTKSTAVLDVMRGERRIREIEESLKEPTERWFNLMRKTDPEGATDWTATNIEGSGIAIRGGKLSASDLRGLLNASYSGEERVGDFILDKRLSTGTSKVYYNPTTTQVVVAHKGTEGVMDWLNNLAFALGGRWGYEKTSRYKEAEKVQREAEEAYGTKNLATIGHSQGALQADLLGQRGKEVITLNKPSHPLKTSSSAIQTDIRTRRDPVSIFTDADITIESEGYNPLKEHSVDTLGRLDPELMIGEGLKSLNQQIHHYKNCLGMRCPPLIPTPDYMEYKGLIDKRNALKRLLISGFSK